MEVRLSRRSKKLTLTPVKNVQTKILRCPKRRRNALASAKEKT